MRRVSKDEDAARLTDQPFSVAPEFLLRAGNNHLEFLWAPDLSFLGMDGDWGRRAAMLSGFAMRYRRAAQREAAAARAGHGHTTMLTGSS